MPEIYRDYVKWAIFGDENVINCEVSARDDKTRKHNFNVTFIMKSFVDKENEFITKWLKYNFLIRIRVKFYDNNYWN